MHDSAAGNDGVLVGGASWVPGYFGSAISLDGMTGYVDVGGSVAYATHDAAFTFTAWTNLTSWLNTTPDIMEIATDSASSPFHVLWCDQSQYLGMSTGDGDGSWIPTMTGAEPTAGAWHHTRWSTTAMVRPI